MFNKMNDSHTALALDYFDYLAESFPVMCASDEFHFLPRAQKASEYYHKLDNLDAEILGERLVALKDFRDRFNRHGAQETDLEKLIDLEILKASVAGILVELETKQSWRHNPLLYLKIAFIGLDHALTKPAPDEGERSQRALARLSMVPRLLKQAIDNIVSVPWSYYQPALSMARDCKSYLVEISASLARGGVKEPAGAVQAVESQLGALEQFLHAISPVEDQDFAVSALEATLRDHFLSRRSLSEIFQIAKDEWEDNEAWLKSIQQDVDPTKSWQALYHAYSPSDIAGKDTMSLYERETDDLRHFFRKHGLAPGHLDTSLEFCETPTYLRSVRSAASFSAAFSGDKREQDLFYITTLLPPERSEEVGVMLKKRLHREYRFLAAHETIPGHHFLDSLRRRLENPVRRQIESPLFYEGWAYYAESLLTEYGYLSSPMDHLVDCKRRLWRAARCQIDVGLSTGMIDHEEAVRLVTTSGFAPEEAENQINRFRLNPGYQLCYTLGRHEIMALRGAFSATMGLDQFHEQLLGGGQLPFHLVEKRLEAM